MARPQGPASFPLAVAFGFSTRTRTVVASSGKRPRRLIRLEGHTEQSEGRSLQEAVLTGLVEVEWRCGSRPP